MNKQYKKIMLAMIETYDKLNRHITDEIEGNGGFDDYMRGVHRKREGSVPDSYYEWKDDYLSEEERVDLLISYCKSDYE